MQTFNTEISSSKTNSIAIQDSDQQIMTTVTDEETTEQALNLLTLLCTKISDIIKCIIGKKY